MFTSLSDVAKTARFSCYRMCKASMKLIWDLTFIQFIATVYQGMLLSAENAYSFFFVNLCFSAFMTRSYGYVAVF